MLSREAAKDCSRYKLWLVSGKPAAPKGEREATTLTLEGRPTFSNTSQTCKSGTSGPRQRQKKDWALAPEKWNSSSDIFPAKDKTASLPAFVPRVTDAFWDLRSHPSDSAFPGNSALV
jgi:hypothetical protein